MLNKRRLDFIVHKIKKISYLVTGSGALANKSSINAIFQVFCFFNNQISFCMAPWKSLKVSRWPSVRSRRIRKVNGLEQLECQAGLLDQRIRLHDLNHQGTPRKAEKLYKALCYLLKPCYFFHSFLCNIGPKNEQHRIKPFSFVQWCSLDGDIHLRSISYSHRKLTMSQFTSSGIFGNDWNEPAICSSILQLLIS